MPTPADIKAIDRLVEDAGWRQGDLVLDDNLAFLHQADPTRPLTDEGEFQAKEATAAGETEGLFGIITPVPGLAVLTQTCDLVRSCGIRKFVELAPLFAADETLRATICKGMRPAYAWLPGAAEHGLVVDLDRVMTVEKAVLAGWPRTPGWATEDDLRSFARALARKRDRFAFPGDFNSLLKPMVDRIKAKHGNLSAEGKALLQVRQIRARAAPSWHDPGPVEVQLTFVIEDGLSAEERTALGSQVRSWCDRVPENPRYDLLPPLVASRDDLTARDMDESDQLDLDHLSG